MRLLTPASHDVGVLLYEVAQPAFGDAGGWEAFRCRRPGQGVIEPELGEGPSYVGVSRVSVKASADHARIG